MKHHLALGLLLALAALGLCGKTALAQTSSSTRDQVTPVPRELSLLNYVVVTPNGPEDGGDFGPKTPGTKTDGIQEAIDFCAKESRVLYIRGEAVYHIHETIHVPPLQSTSVRGGVYVLNWEGPPEKDLLVLDSAMNCEYYLGILVYGGHGAALRVRPERPVPIDNFPVWVESQVFCQTIADPHPFQAGERTAGTGVVLDGTAAAISHCDFYFASVLNFHTCVELSGNVSFNDFRIPHLHTNADRSTLMVVGNRVCGNHFLLTLGVDQGAKDVTGLVLGGQQNTLELGKRGCNQPFPPGRALILSETAQGNQIALTNSENDRPEELLTDQARVPTNQLTSTGSPLPIRVLEHVGPDFTYQQRLYAATVRWSGGQLRRATLTRDDTPVDLGAATDRELLLSVGDQLHLESTTAPTVHVIPVKTK